MAKASKKVIGVPASIVLNDDAPAIGHNARSVIDLSAKEGDSAQAMVNKLVSLIRSPDKKGFNFPRKATNDKDYSAPVAAILKDYTIGKLMSAGLAKTEVAATIIVDKPNYNSLPSANNEKNKSDKQTKVCRAAARMFSWHLDKDELYGKPAKLTAPRTPKGDAPTVTAPTVTAPTVTAPTVTAPVTIGSIALPKTATPKAFIHEAAQLISALKRLQKINKDMCKGDDASALLIWLSEAPSFAD